MSGDESPEKGGENNVQTLNAVSTVIIFSISIHMQNSIRKFASILSAGNSRNGESENSNKVSRNYFQK